MAPLEVKRGEARPLPPVGLPSLNSKSPTVQAEQGRRALSDIRQTEEKPELSFTHAHLHRLQNFSGEEALSSVGEGEDDLWQVHRKQTHGKKLTLLETQTV